MLRRLGCILFSGIGECMGERALQGTHVGLGIPLSYRQVHGCMQGRTRQLVFTYTVLCMGRSYCWQVAVVCKGYSRQYCLRIYCI